MKLCDGEQRLVADLDTCFESLMEYLEYNDRSEKTDVFYDLSHDLCAAIYKFKQRCGIAGE